MLRGNLTADEQFMCIKGKSNLLYSVFFLLFLTHFIFFPDDASLKTQGLNNQCYVV